jgi:nitrogen fixation protein FixH
MTMSATAWFADGVRGRHVLLGLVAFFGLIFAVNGVFIYYALSTFGGGDTSDPYRKGLHYNDTLAEAAREAEQGWDARLTYAATPGHLALNLTDKDGHPVSGLHFSGTVGRPATDREDLSANFREIEGGSYVAELKLAPGQWVVQLQSNELSRAGNPTYRLKRRVFVPETP